MALVDSFLVMLLSGWFWLWAFKLFAIFAAVLGLEKLAKDAGGRR